jgi:hypothetical protein
VERSEGSRQKLLGSSAKEGGGLGKWASISMQQKFSPEELIVESIVNSEKVFLIFDPPASCFVS